MFDPLSRYDHLAFWAPLGEARAEALIGLLELDGRSVVADVGCGRAELLVRIVERYGSQAVAIDADADALAIARAEMERRAPDAEARFEVADAASLSAPERPFDHLTCIGGPTVGEGLESTIGSLASWVRPGGTLLLGLGVWKRPPPPAYLEATGIEEASIRSYVENLASMKAAGLTLLYSCLGNRDEWDHFEGRILANVERAYAATPEDAALRDRAEGLRVFYDAQQRWGRDAMGFGYYLLRRA